ncbi:zinc finger protein 518B [Emydura macquarii macquarii]|uniref:zinc finger protein 518B n=1 Tax=Emydura macquarii macquarii TaxID=1129001 RepID=UPI003529FC4E
MQLKKMREILPKLYTSQVNDINNSLTTSPKQANEDKTNQPKGTEGQNCFYQGAEAEDKLSLALCIKCRSVQKLPGHELQKHNKPRQTEDKNFICSNCSLNTSPAFHFVADSVTCIDLENQEKTSLSKTQKTFKVKNFQPDKYYCDKCRFSTKDPLQYKKHVFQHEEIKFVCSHCNCVSYTKGEFQRHLVKHTGTFPYQCEYCEYGAVRHDYIVKHTRRVHETVTEKGLTNMATKHVQKRSCLPKPSILFSEKQKCDPKVPLQNEPSDLSSTTCSKIQDEITKTVCLSGDIECNVHTASVQHKTVLEPAEVNIYENQNVEVEVYSPKKEPVQPGMPLTVIAPSELVVPSNCLAQLLEIKVVNGTQQLVLKLIPLKETSNEPINCEEEELGNQGTEQTDKGERITSIAQNEVTTEVTVDKLSSVSNLPASDHKYKNSECLSSSNSHTSDCNSNVHSQDKSKISCPNSSSNKEKYAKNYLNDNLYCYKDTLDVSTCAHATSSEGDRSQNVLLQAAQENSSSSSSSALGEKDILPLNGDDKEYRSQFSSSLETHLFDACLVKESFKTSQGGGESSLNKRASLETSSVGLSKLNSENSNCQNNNLLEALELQNVENKESPLEGPVISSVFSLSLGAENIPEGIKWDNTAYNKKSTTMLCRKIAQLMSAAESNVKSTLVASSMPVRSCASNKKPQETSANYERNTPAPELEQSASSLQTPQNGGISNEQCNKEQPQSVAATTKTKSRVTKNTHIATPVFIPKGTVLRVLNATRSENTEKAGDKNEMLATSMCCNEMFLPRPVPFSISEKLSSNLSLPNESELNEQSRNQNISLRHRPKREANVKSNSKQNGVLLHQKSDELNKQSKLTSKGQLAPKNKVKQASSKKKTRIHSETNGISEAMPLLTARRLRLVPLRTNQLIICPRRNQPVVVLNHPDVDSPEIINVMKIINKYKGNVLKVVLSERTSSYLAVKQYNKRLTFQNFETTSQVKKQNMLKMKLKKTHKNNYRVVETSPAKTLKCMFKCWFCGRIYVDQEEWIIDWIRHMSNEEYL